MSTLFQTTSVQMLSAINTVLPVPLQDKNPDNNQVASEKFKKISEAYDVSHLPQRNGDDLMD